MQDDIQAKTTVDTPNLAMLLHTMKEHDLLDERIPVVFWRKTGKSKEGRFMEKGKFAVCFLEDYIKLLRFREAAELLLPYVNAIKTSPANPTEEARVKRVMERLRELDFLHD
jgi:hypothetical protein